MSAPAKPAKPRADLDRRCHCGRMAVLFDSFDLSQPGWCSGEHAPPSTGHHRRWLAEQAGGTA